MRQGQKHQQGTVLIVMIAAIIMIALTVLVTRTGDLVAIVGKRFSATTDAEYQIQKALISFVATYQRLPCPANPLPAVANPGWPDDIKPLALPASTTCTFQAGIVPWNALGLSQAQVTDEWGRLISYRVYDGQFGLTQNNGASALNCDTNNLTTPNVPPTFTGMCDNTSGTHDTLHNATTPNFVTFNFPPNPVGSTPSYNKGLTVTDFGANKPNVAFALISHGPSGVGGYMPNGLRSTPIPVTRDYANTQAPPAIFIREGASAADIPPGATGHYDDIVTYLTIAELLKLSKQDARDWPEVGEILPSITPATTSNMTSPSANSAAPHFVTTGSGGQEFVQVMQPNGVAAVAAGLGEGSYSSCLWWPLKMYTVSGSSRNLIAASVEFAAVDNTSGDSFPGFTLGFLSGADAAGPPMNSTCGTSIAATTTAVNTINPDFIDVGSTTGILVGMNVYGVGVDINTTVIGVVGTTVQLSKLTTGTVSTVSFADSRLIRRNLGWEGGTLANYIDRFAIEFDANRDQGSAGPPPVPTANDPNRPHLSVNFGGVTHGTSASSCTPTAYGLNCDSQVADFPLVTRTATGTSGTTTINITDALGVSGIVHGMSISGTGIAAGAKVSAITGNIVTLDTPNISAVSGLITFNPISTSNFMQNGLTVFNVARVEVSSNDCVAYAGTGTSGTTTIDVSSSSGIESGMLVYGEGIASSATVLGVSGLTVTLSAPNSAAIAGTMVNFGGSSAVSTSATGSAGLSTITVTTPQGISVGMSVVGTGIAPGATVQSFSGTQITLSVANTGVVSGVTTFTQASPLTRSLVKSWTLSNAGCNENLTTCNALKNTSAKFSSDLSANRQVMHAVSCMLDSVVPNAYDSLYFGITTANRSNNGVASTNVVFQGLSVQRPVLP